MSFRKGRVDKGEIISALEAIIKELRASQIEQTSTADRRPGLRDGSLSNSINVA